VTILAYLVLLGWPLVVLGIFNLRPHRQAVAAAMVGAWLILPPYRIEIGELPDYSKITAAVIGVLLCTLIYCPDRLWNFRPRWFDLPMLLFCFCMVPSSLQNGLGLYDGLSGSLDYILMWGLPYLFGRLYFGTLQGIQSFATAMIIGGLACVPFCLFEMRMSPKLLYMIYGGTIEFNMRLGGYRPKLFFSTGLELGMWMTAASLAGWWLWRCGTITKIRETSSGRVLLPILLGTTIFCRSTGAIALLFFGAILLWLSVRFRTRLLLASLIFAAPLYVGVRTTRLWSGQQAVDWAVTLAGPERAQSLEYRFQCEDLLMAKALQQPYLGWGGWGRSSVDWNGVIGKHVPTDGLWIIIFGTNGFYGLVLLYLAMILPLARFMWRFPVRFWGLPQMAAASLAAVLLSLYMIDCLLNAFVNVIYVTLAGGLNGIELAQLHTSATGTEGATRRKPASRQDAALVEGLRAIDQSYSKGQTLKAEGRFEEAQVAWLETLDLLGTLTKVHSNQPDLWHRWCDSANDLAWLELHHLELPQSELPAVIALARRAVELYPDSAAYWNTLGTACFRAGDNESAVTALGHAIDLGGGTPFDDVFLAMAHARSGNRQQAEHYLAQAVASMERGYSGHPELVRFCDEAQAILNENPETFTAIR
jgi:tetratricopeptide (TPR) repeat protein